MLTYRSSICPSKAWLALLILFSAGGSWQEALGQSRFGASPALRYGEARAVRNFHPYGAIRRWAETDRLLSVIYEPLYRYDYLSEAFVPVLVSGEPRTSVENGNLVVRLRVKDGVTWHDGKPFTAADVRWNVEYLKYAATNLEDRRFFSEGILDVRVEDRLGVAIVFKGRPPQWQVFLEHWLIPAHCFGDGMLDDQCGLPLSSHPIGTGPFKLLESTQAGRNARLAVNADYHSDPPALEILEMQTLVDQTTRVRMLTLGPDQNGLGLLVETPPERVNELAALEQIQYQELEAFGVYAIAIRIREGTPLADARFRRALTMAINREGILRNYYTDVGEIVASPVVRAAPFFSTRVEPLSYDTAGARAIIREYPNPGSLRLIFPKETGSSTTRVENSVEEVRLNLRAVGIDVQLIPMEVQEFNIATENRNFDLAWMRWEFDPIYDLSNFFHSKYAGPGGLNVMGYRNPDVDRSLDDFMAATDQNRRRSIMDGLQEVLRDDAPAIFMFDTRTIYAYQNWLIPTRVDPFYFFSDIATWQINR